MHSAQAELNSHKSFSFVFNTDKGKAGCVPQSLSFHDQPWSGTEACTSLSPCRAMCCRSQAVRSKLAGSHPRWPHRQCAVCRGVACSALHAHVHMPLMICSNGPLGVAPRNAAVCQRLLRSVHSYLYSAGTFCNRGTNSRVRGWAGLVRND